MKHVLTSQVHQYKAQLDSCARSLVKKQQQQQHSTAVQRSSSWQTSDNEHTEIQYDLVLYSFLKQINVSISSLTIRELRN
jgi:hypothetical protein